MKSKGIWHRCDDPEKARKAIENLSKASPDPVVTPQIGEPYSSIEYMPLAVGEIVEIKGEKFVVRKITTRHIVLRSVRC